MKDSKELVRTKQIFTQRHTERIAAGGKRRDVKDQLEKGDKRNKRQGLKNL